MASYEVQVFESRTLANIYRFPVSQSPYASYSKGDTLDLRSQGRGSWQIENVQHLIIGSSVNEVRGTRLMVSSFAASFAADGDNALWTTE